jgi:hypothetical protein
MKKFNELYEATLQEKSNQGAEFYIKDLKVGKNKVNAKLFYKVDGDKATVFTGQGTTFSGKGTTVGVTKKLGMNDVEDFFTLSVTYNKVDGKWEADLSSIKFVNKFTKKTGSSKIAKAIAAEAAKEI